ncbi:MAG: flagellar basal body rod protein FlgB [Phycisphaerales bacterium]
MLIGDLANSGAIPALEASLKFAASRQKLIAHNIANADTPDFRVQDVDPAHFQQSLRKAVEQRRQRTGGQQGGLSIGSTRQMQLHADGRIELRPRTPSENLLFHDRNDRDLERLMQANAENVAAYRLSVELLRSRFDLLRSAIAERA